MRPSVLLGIVLLLVGVGGLVRGCQLQSTGAAVTADANRSSPDAPPAEGLPYRFEHAGRSTGVGWAVVGGLALAGGFAAIGIGLGNWRRPRKVGHPADTGPE